jgi:hypothetical protein
MNSCNTTFVLQGTHSFLEEGYLGSVSGYTGGHEDVVHVLIQ